jgi:hypothetical protein
MKELSESGGTEGGIGGERLGVSMLEERLVVVVVTGARDRRSVSSLFNCIMWTAEKKPTA